MSITYDDGCISNNFLKFVLISNLITGGLLKALTTTQIFNVYKLSRMVMIGHNPSFVKDVSVTV